MKLDNARGQATVIDQATASTGTQLQAARNKTATSVSAAAGLPADRHRGHLTQL